MKAAVIKKFGTSDVFEIADMPIPKPNDNQILVRVYASGINPIDWKQRKGNHRFILGAPFPIVLGYDVCAEVVETGSEITKLNVGDVVFGVLDNKYGGALAEYALGTEKCFTLAPRSIRFEHAAAFPMASLTSLQALRDKAKLQPGSVVLINGASGGVGHIAVQIAKIMEAKVIAVSSNRNQSFVESLQPYLFIDYDKQDILKLDFKVDVFFDVSGIYSFRKCKHLLNSGGVYINTLPRPKILFHKVLQLFTKGKKVKTLLMKHNADDLRQISQWIKEGRLKVEIDEIFNLNNISAAHNYAEAGHSKGKNVVIIN
ncbi:MAG: NADP-dependent oxidoreductase [Marinilabiliales bacterium]|nr:NADP-dependent oxidoreductase [Marinilabiliales bacterium]